MQDRPLISYLWSKRLRIQHQIFVNFKQAYSYDSIDRNVLYKVMLDLGIPAKLVSTTRMTMSHRTALVRVNNCLTNAFETNVGLKQGDGLAPLLFNLALEQIIRK